MRPCPHWLRVPSTHRQRWLLVLVLYNDLDLFDVFIAGVVISDAVIALIFEPIMFK